MNPTPNPLPALREGAMMYLITAGSAVIEIILFDYLYLYN